MKLRKSNGFVSLVTGLTLLVFWSQCLVTPQLAQAIAMKAQPKASSAAVVKQVIKRFTIEPIARSCDFYLTHVDPKLPKILRPVTIIPREFSLTFTNPQKRYYVFWDAPVKFGWFVTPVGVAAARLVLGKDVFALGALGDMWLTWAGYHFGNAILGRASVALDDSFKPVTASKFEKRWKQFLQLSTNVYLSGISYTLIKAGPSKVWDTMVGLTTNNPALVDAKVVAMGTFILVVWGWGSQFINTFIATPHLFGKFPQSNFITELETNHNLEDLIQTQEKRIVQAEADIIRIQNIIQELKNELKSTKDAAARKDLKKQINEHSKEVQGLRDVPKYAKTNIGWAKRLRKNIENGEPIPKKTWSKFYWSKKGVAAAFVIAMVVLFLNAKTYVHDRHILPYFKKLYGNLTENDPNMALTDAELKDVEQVIEEQVKATTELPKSPESNDSVDLNSTEK